MSDSEGQPESERAEEGVLWGDGGGSEMKLHQHIPMLILISAKLANN